MGLSGNNSIGLELADSQMKMGKPNDQVRFDAQSAANKKPPHQERLGVSARCTQDMEPAC